MSNFITNRYQMKRDILIFSKKIQRLRTGYEKAFRNRRVKVGRRCGGRQVLFGSENAEVRR